MKERYNVNDEASFQVALLHVKHHLTEFGFKNIQIARYLTAVSELARNILKYAGKGVIEVNTLYGIGKQGVEVIAIDQGNGIDDLSLAMQDKYSSSGTMGQGLPGAKRLVDEFFIESSAKGTKVTLKMWL